MESDIQRSIGKLEGKIDLLVATIAELKASFENLEKGRLSRLEINFATLQAEVKDKSRSTAIWTSSGISLLIAILTAFFIHYIK